MVEFDSKEIIRQVRKVYDKITYYSEKAEVDNLLKLYKDDKNFVSFGSEGIKRTYKEFRDVCNDYYATLKKQKIETIDEKFNVLSENIVITSWHGNIHAYLKSGAVLDMLNCGVTNVFIKEAGEWKIIHSHESSLLPKFMKK